MSAPKARILAIDDQLYFRSFLDGLLSEEGFDVTTEAGGPQALETLAQDGPFDIVILDVAMAETDGAAMIGRIRSRHPEIGVIVASSAGDVRSVVDAMRKGASDYLLKPIDRDGLLAAISKALAQHRGPSDNTRLVDENLEFMGRLSELERALPLVGATDLVDAAQGVLDLLCGAAGVEDGILWVADAETSSLSTSAVRGRMNEDTLPRDWVAEDDGVLVAMRAGEPHAIGGLLHIPCLRGEELVAVVRLGSDDASASEAAETCMRLSRIAALVLWNARALSTRPQTAAADDAPGPGAELLRDPATGLPSRGFFDLVLATEVHKAQRYGRRLSCICVDSWGDLGAPESSTAVVAAVARTLRTSDSLASENGSRFWVLVTDNDALGGVVLKRRLADRVRDAAGSTDADVAVGMATYPHDGESSEQLIDCALRNLECERRSIVHQLGLRADSPLAEMAERLLAHAKPEPEGLVAEAAELLLGELSCRPRDRGLLFLAPGSAGGPVMAPLRALGDVETATEVFLATDGDTLPCGPAVTAVMLPTTVPPEITWMVRFGEGPLYALVAGARSADGTRPVFHTSDSVLVEHLTFRLRADVGFGVRTGCGY
ncbi:MAG: response regulator [Deltaproteobacteria bacterium]|nr:response regulator [Deltaproteobacteria bacterium]MBW2413556.1 response regulator [Deltaproteobacteria bacterium]